jgi:hypothetical protein
MNFRKGIGICFILLLITSALPILNEKNASAETNVDFSINLVGLPPRFNIAGYPVIVSGVWHDLLVYKHNLGSIQIRLYKGSNEPVDKNETNFYFWEYNETFQGSVNYIDISKCSNTADKFKFRIGLHISVEQGLWTMAFFSNNEFLETKTILVEAFRPGVSFYSPDIRLRVEPFTVATVSSESQNLKVSMSNDGNVPMNFSVVFESFSNSASMTGVGEITNPNNMSGHYVKFSANNLKPGIIKINSTISAYPQHVINASFINLIPSFGTTFRFEVYVGRAGYEIEPFGNIVVQYPKEVPMNHTETRDISVYITGSESQLEFTVSNIKLKGVKLNDAVKDTKSAISIPASESKENKVKFTVNANRPEVRAQIKLNVKDLTTSVSKTFIINIPVGPRNMTANIEPAQQNDSTPAMLFLAVSIIALVGIMGFVFIRKKSKEKRKRRKKKHGLGK